MSDARDEGQDIIQRLSDAASLECQAMAPGWGPNADLLRDAMDRIAALEAEVARLTREKDEARKLAEDELTTAYLAGAASRPSPAPSEADRRSEMLARVQGGDCFATEGAEARWIADMEAACPACGGSGHRDDAAPSEAVRGGDGSEGNHRFDHENKVDEAVTSQKEIGRVSEAVRERMAAAIRGAFDGEPGVSYRMADAALAVLASHGDREPREPDHCYDPSCWEWTNTWEDRETLTEDMAPGEVMKIAALYNGPTAWVGYAAIDTTGDGEADDYERRWFWTEEAARAFAEGERNG